MGAIVGYARTSTTEQIAGLEAQHRDLTAAGVTRLYSERVSSVAHREELQHALDYIPDRRRIARPAFATGRRSGHLRRPWRVFHRNDGQSRADRSSNHQCH
ncbi:hypothetical protein B5P45_03465 [Phyllobacterium zundukense]|uniref:Resolvase/invertase-type recombinase catalytic domain-containing protein n=1 Tax=Phyllobacterium zundukense TaxID=1867719 RepID=A0A2N9W364_9HYPH|nr:hypothetical protein B5P45_03465 [Phyllobacterium zundukense]